MTVEADDFVRRNVPLHEVTDVQEEHPFSVADNELVSRGNVSFVDSNEPSDLSRQNSSSCLRQNSYVSDAMSIEVEETFYGWGSFHPKCLQRFNSPRWMLFFICLFVSIQAKLVSGFLNTSLSTIEKVFGFTSVDSGLIISTYDIASMLAVLPISYLGQTRSKPMFVACGGLLISLGCFIFFLPEAFRAAYSWRVDGEVGMCSSIYDPLCRDYSSNHGLKFVFMVGTCLIGIGATPLYTLGVAYIDENVKRENSALYLGIFYTVAVVAPAFGFILSGLFLRIPLDFKHWGVELSDPSWVGAWYIGFIMQAVLALLIAFPIAGLPKRIKGAPSLKSDTPELPTDYNELQKPPTMSFGSSIREFPSAIRILIKIHTYLLLVCHGFLAYFVLSGLAAFLPKYFQYQFSLNASDAAFICGSIAVPAAAFGTFTSGFLIKKLHFSNATIMRMVLFIQVSVIPFLLFFLFHCPRYGLAGVFVSYNDVEKANGLLVDCNRNCNCDASAFNPICGENGVTYFSPCFAGCQTKDFTDCACLYNNVTNTYQSVKDDICPVDCWIRSVNFIVFFCLLFISSMVSVPHITSILRIVPDSQRGLALGVQWIFVRMLGTIPGPIVYGKFIDMACVLWNGQEQSSCESKDTGSCFAYDQQLLGILLLLLSSLPLCLGCGLLLLAVSTFPKQKTTVEPIKEMTSSK